MNTAESAGGSSCRKQENGDASSDCERPLKKARFPWQVKGKYHLKNDAGDSNKASTSESVDPSAASSSSSGSTSNNISTEQIPETIDPNYLDLLRHDVLTLEAVITDPVKTLHIPSASDNELSMASKNLTERQCIAQWQGKQFAQSFIDNSINRILDSGAHLPEHARRLAMEVADFINNLPGERSVEDEGILMAISAHGLQNNEPTNNNSYPSMLMDSSPSPSESDPDESQEEINNNTISINDLDIDDDLSNDMPWPYDNDHINDVPQFNLFPDSVSGFQYNRGNHQNSNAYNNGVDNQCDFLDTAVNFAIQSKGLNVWNIWN